MDWNVFFSTVSQTTGGIVGIFAAFLITKIVANQSEYSRNKEKASDYIRRSRALAHESETRYFEWYNKRTAEKELSEIDDSFNETDEILSAEEYYKNLDFSPFQDKKEALKLIQNKVDDLAEKKRIEEERVRSEMDRQGPGHAVNSNKPMHMSNLSAFAVNTAKER